MRAGLPAGIAFLPARASLAVADGAAGTVTVIDGLNGQPSMREAVPAAVISADSLFLQTTSDGTAVILAGSGSQTAYRVGLAGQTVRSLDVQAAISGLDRLMGDVFLFSAVPNQAAWMIEADGANFVASFAQFNGQARKSIRPGEGPVR